MSGITKQEIMDGVVPNKKIDKPKSKYTKAQLFEIIEELEQEAEWWGEIKDDLTFQLGGMKCDRDQKEEQGDKLYQDNQKLMNENILSFDLSEKDALSLCEYLKMSEEI